MSWLSKLRLSYGSRSSSNLLPTYPSSPIPQSLDEDQPLPIHQFAQFGAGCFWGVELAFQRVPGVSQTEVGYSQGTLNQPSYNDVYSGMTNHSEVVRVQYNEGGCGYDLRELARGVLEEA